MANNIFYVILSIVSVLITGVLIPLLKQKYSKEKIVSVMEAIDIAVKAAEQIYTKAGQGQLKKQYVLMRLNEQGIKLSEKELDDMIEASVLELNRWKMEISKWFYEMKLSIRYKPRCYDRPWLVKRVNGKYGQHAHMRRKKDAVKLRNLLDKNLMPYSEEFKTAAKRLLSEKEYKNLENSSNKALKVLRKNKKPCMGLVET